MSLDLEILVKYIYYLAIWKNKKNEEMGKFYLWKEN